MSTQHSRRRSTDGAGSLDISQMIADENDPKQRAFLIVLHSINQSLEANTNTVKEISDKLEGHLEEFGDHVVREEKLLNQGRGAWKIFAWVVSIAQLLATYGWVTQRNDMQELNKTLQTELINEAAMRNRMETVEKSLGLHLLPGLSRETK